MGLPSLHATAMSRHGWEEQRDPLFRGEQNKWRDLCWLCLVCHEDASSQMLTSDMTSSGLLPSLDRCSGLLCRRRDMFYLLYLSGLLKQCGGEGIAKITVHVSLMSWGYRLWEFPFANSAIDLWSLRSA